MLYKCWSGFTSKIWLYIGSSQKSIAGNKQKGLDNVCPGGNIQLGQILKCLI